MSNTDPGVQASAWSDWPAGERAPGVELKESLLTKWANRTANLRARAIAADDIAATLSPPPTAQTPVGSEGRIWFPPWAKRLVLGVEMTYTIADTLNAGTVYAQTRFGSGTYVWSGRVSVALLWGRKDPEGGGTIPPPNADGNPETGSGVPFRKRMILTVPASYLGTEQPYQVFGWGTSHSGDLMEITTAGMPWYFVE